MCGLHWILRWASASDSVPDCEARSVLLGTYCTSRCTWFVCLGLGGQTSGGDFQWGENDLCAWTLQRVIRSIGGCVILGEVIFSRINLRAISGSRLSFRLLRSFGSAFSRWKCFRVEDRLQRRDFLAGDRVYLKGVF